MENPSRDRHIQFPKIYSGHFYCMWRDVTMASVESAEQREEMLRRRRERDRLRRERETEEERQARFVNANSRYMH